ncbi:MAG: Re/Si-specific NAD(P)(+) transhydrogenase subunit alpha [Gammaproteobacteria bacterium]|nr:Re/Si-specific NAD(P)(+) transhydrogenase subunit alpha [Gammaproteobacteria bacterium]NIR98216.1 Re/Si-specific NAD(P)(+) transhydrogenase subunit alpha [Gammaproteobacteria bacterium]NIT63887.1 Re/Si-specific NAD(P)(+) transhydrogenase subunit alpha [Gammaproteobacteria bacterium]NIV20891.1 Re/Si-specific NAD(P)(+) transhydrogenase subunit alpha [Gammaproteobacteria bacterium]NIY32467.1 Re/Si-specific NAD(P)(+) transhydrogenase subunit alpha [Gammaproteobacteria bacterium]
MPIRVAAPKETVPGERRVAISPDAAERYRRAGAQVLLERGAGEGSFFPDSDYGDVTFADSAKELFAQADVVLKVQPPSEEEIAMLAEGALVVGFMQPHRFPERVEALRRGKVTALAMELVPRITRAQSMDALSSQANIAGYKAALMAANRAAQFFPMLTTAAGTIRPAKVLVLGAGVAGLQAIATARRLGAMVEAYDVRAATKEQVQSLGAKFLELVGEAEAEGGYARELTEAEKKQEYEMLVNHVAAANAVITTAAIPGRPSPRLIDAGMVERMRPGSVIVDLAAERGGNCELTRPGEEVEHNGVVVYGPLNVPSMLPVHASEMYAKNLFNLLQLMIGDGELRPDWEDEVLAGATLTRDGEIRHEPTRNLVEGGQS